MSTNWGTSRTVREVGARDCLRCHFLTNTVLLSQTLGGAGESHPMSGAQAELRMLVTEGESSLLWQKGLQHSAGIPAAVISLAIA